MTATMAPRLAPAPSAPVPPDRPPRRRRALRPLVWVRWNRRRAVGTLVVVAVGLWVVAPSHHHRAAAPLGVGLTPSGVEVPPVPATATTVAPSASPGGQVPAVTPSTLPGPRLPAGALTAAEVFVAAWASHAPRAAWMGQMVALATPTLVAALTGQDPALVPAHRVTGPATGNGDATGGTAAVPTDIGPVAVIVVASGTGWRAATVVPLVP